MNITEYKQSNAQKNAIYSKWKRLNNVSTTDIRNFLNSKEFKSIEDRIAESYKTLADRTIKLKQTSKLRWTPEMYEWANTGTEKIQSILSKPTFKKINNNGYLNIQHRMLLVLGHSVAPIEKKEEGGQLTPSEGDKEIIKNFKKVVNVDLKRLQQFGKNLSQEQKSWAEVSADDVKRYGILPKFQNHQFVINALKKTDNSEWSEDDLDNAMNLLLYIKALKSNPTKLHKDEVRYKLLSLGVDTNKVGLRITEQDKDQYFASKMRMLRASSAAMFTKSYKVKNHDFFQWLEPLKPEIEIIKSRLGNSKFIIRGFKVESPIFVYNQKTETFHTNEGNTETLPKGNEVLPIITFKVHTQKVPMSHPKRVDNEPNPEEMATGGELKKVVRHNLPINKSYKIIDAYYTGGVESGNTLICENCGKMITNVAVVKSDDGNQYNVGMDCAETLSGIKNSNEFEQTLADFNESKAVRAKINNAKKKYPNSTVKSEILYFGKISTEVSDPKSTYARVSLDPEFFFKYFPDYEKTIDNPEKIGFKPACIDQEINIPKIQLREHGEFKKFFDPIELDINKYKVVIKHTHSMPPSGRMNEHYGIQLLDNGKEISIETTYMERDIPDYVCRVINKREFDLYDASKTSSQPIPPISDDTVELIAGLKILLETSTGKEREELQATIDELELSNKQNPTFGQGGDIIPKNRGYVVTPILTPL